MSLNVDWTRFNEEVSHGPVDAHRARFRVLGGGRRHGMGLHGRRREREPRPGIANWLVVTLWALVFLGAVMCSAGWW